MHNDSAIILFDGVCNLCNGFVQFVIKKDKRNFFKFGSLQSDAAKLILKKYNIDEELKTVILIFGGVVYTKSSAALRIAKLLGFPYSLLYVLMLIPKFIRNAVYDLIARYRYKVFGRQDSCLLPTEELKNKFID